jgi:transcriptional regulator with XRE-family HTH domain
MKKRKLTPFGLKVKNKLADLNMSQKELAEKLSTSDVYLSMILYGERSGDMYIEDIKTILKIEHDN